MRGKIKMYLYAIRNVKTNKLVNRITNPGRKFWEKEGSCRAALASYKSRYPHVFKQNINNKPEDLEIVKFKLKEVCL